MIYVMWECRNNVEKCESRETWRERFTKIESGHDPRRKKKGCFAKALKLINIYRSWDDLMFLVGPVLVTWMKNKEVVHKRVVSPSMCLSYPSLILSFSQLFYTFPNKSKRKEDYIFLHKCHYGVMVKALICRIIESKFKLQSCY